jgi:hypothetical protein
LRCDFVIQIVANDTYSIVRIDAHQVAVGEVVVVEEAEVLLVDEGVDVSAIDFAEASCISQFLTCMIVLK